MEDVIQKINLYSLEIGKVIRLYNVVLRACGGVSFELHGGNLMNTRFIIHQTLLTSCQTGILRKENVISFSSNIKYSDRI